MLYILFIYIECFNKIFTFAHDIEQLSQQKYKKINNQLFSLEYYNVVYLLFYFMIPLLCIKYLLMPSSSSVLLSLGITYIYYIISSFIIYIYLYSIYSYSFLYISFHLCILYITQPASKPKVNFLLSRKLIICNINSAFFSLRIFFSV